MIITQIVLLIIGLILIVKGADWLVDGASSVARRAGISEFVIGLTIVGFGTSCPELVVSLTGSISGNSSIAIGNVLGSNIFNTMMILGVTAVVSPILVTRSNKTIDIPVNAALTLLLVLFGMSCTLFGIGASDNISRIEGAMFLLFFAAYIYWSFKTGKEDAVQEAGSSETAAAQEGSRTRGKALFLIVLGLAGLVIGGRFFVNSATNIAKTIGVSDKVIAITILSIGTSLPELATCVVAAAKGKGQLALGNIIGSNIFNILLILGCSAVVHPIDLSGITMIDMGTMLGSVLLVMLFAFFGGKERIGRWEGGLLVIGEVAYMTALLTIG